MMARSSYQTIAGELLISVLAQQPQYLFQIFQIDVKVAKVTAINFEIVGSQSGGADAGQLC